MTRREVEIELHVTYGTVSISDSVARIGLAIDRSCLTIAQADRTFCGRQLAGTLLARPGGWRSDQPPLPGMSDDLELEVRAAVKGFAADERAIRLGLAFALSDIDVEVLIQMARRQGIFYVRTVEAIQAQRKAKATPQAFPGPSAYSDAG